MRGTRGPSGRRGAEETFSYAPWYCEENVWHLCRDARLAGPSSRVVLISNRHRACALWAQRAAPSPGAPVIWDYHVILVVVASAGWEVWDLDTTLGLPCALGRYVDGTFPRRSLELPTFVDLAPRFRVIESDTYRDEFSSDRSHMRRPDGSWLRPPPAWPPVFRPGAPSFLQWSVMTDDDDGVVSLHDLVLALERGG